MVRPDNTPATRGVRSWRRVLHRLTPMPSTRVLPPLLLIALTATVGGCSTGGVDKAQPAATAPVPEQPGAAAPDGKIAMSPGGVTTKIDVPAQSTEEQYAQACMNAKDWMAAKGGDAHTLVEPYLKQAQSPGQVGPATFGKTWTELREAEQAAVIIAVRAAADGGC